METRHRSPKRRRQHRLARSLYRGEVTVAFTACLAGKVEAFVSEKGVSVMLQALRRAADKHGARVLVYCFMPNHAHIILQGASPSSDLWKTMTLFKQITGHWLGRHRPGVRWQGDFFDHIIRGELELERHIRYTVENPVRRGLVLDWRQYPFLGSGLLPLDMLANGGEDPA